MLFHLPGAPFTAAYLAHSYYSGLLLQEALPDLLRLGRVPCLGSLHPLGFPVPALTTLGHQWCSVYLPHWDVRSGRARLGCLSHCLCPHLGPVWCWHREDAQRIYVE